MKRCYNSLLFKLLPCHYDLLEFLVSGPKHLECHLQYFPTIQTSLMTPCCVRRPYSAKFSSLHSASPHCVQKDWILIGTCTCFPLVEARSWTSQGLTKICEFSGMEKYYNHKVVKMWDLKLCRFNHRNHEETTVKIFSENKQNNCISSSLKGLSVSTKWELKILWKFF